MPKQLTNPTVQPLTAAVPPLDKYWAIETSFARSAQRELDKHDFAAHMEKFRAGFYDDDEEDGSTAPSKPCAVNGDGVALLYLSGPLTKRPTSMSYLFGGTSTIQMRRMVRQAAADPDVKAVALIIDSPGGQVNGTADLAADVAAACEKKPVGAYAEDTCCSAAYWIGSQADFLYCNQTAAVGSIGTLLVIEDTSKAYAQEGVKVHVVSTGPYKGAGADGSVITKAHLEDFQREVDDINACFLEGVSDGRENLTMEQVQNLATGQVHIGQKAVDLGLCDAVTSLDEFLESLAIHISMQAEDPDAPASAPLPDGQESPGGDTDSSASTLSSTLSSAQEENADNALDPPAEALRGTQADTISAQTDSAIASDRITDLTARAEFLTPSLKEKDTMPDETLVPATSATAAALPASSARSAANNDILTACQAAGISSAKELAERLSMARLGDRYAAEVREDAKVQAVRAFGAETGNQLAASCDALPVEIVASMRDGWQAQADKTFGIGADGKAPVRQSAPAAQRVSVPAEHGADGGPEAAETKWNKLTAAQQQMGTQMGMKTPEQRESFAAQYLTEKESDH